MACDPGGRPMKVVVLTGPESTGKSWLADRLRRRFGGLLVDEYVRHYIERPQRDTTLADIPAIARGQLAREDAARAAAPHLLILDTHLLSNMLSSRTPLGGCPHWLKWLASGPSANVRQLPGHERCWMADRLSGLAARPGAAAGRWRG